MSLKVWTLDPARLRGPACLEALRKRLGRDERERADRFRRTADREMFIAAHALLRAALARETRHRMESLQFERETYGRPLLTAMQQPDPPVTFSLSHTPGCAAVALSRTGPVGIDVEAATRLASDPAGFAAQWFHPNEVREVEQASAAGAAQLAVSLWCLKEAYGKALGLGLRVSTKASWFAIEGQRATAMVLPGGACSKRWRFALFDLASGHRLALATEDETGTAVPCDGAQLLEPGP